MMLVVLHSIIRFDGLWWLLARHLEWTFQQLDDMFSDLLIVNIIHVMFLVWSFECVHIFMLS